MTSKAATTLKSVCKLAFTLPMYTRMSFFDFAKKKRYAKGNTSLHRRLLLLDYAHQNC